MNILHENKLAAVKLPMANFPWLIRKVSFWGIRCKRTIALFKWS